MVRAAIQLYTLRNVELPFTEILERVAEAGFEGVEFAYRVTDEDPADVAATLEETGLSVAGAHVMTESLEDDFGSTVEFYETLGCRDVVVPYLDDEYFRSESDVAAGVERLSAIADELAASDVDLHYHNHTHEFVDVDGTTAFDLFVDESEFGIEYDVGLGLLAGDDPVDRLESLGGRAPLVHLKDVDVEGDGSVPLGEGDVDLEACAEHARANGSEWLIYEFEGDDPMASLDDAAATVRNLR